MDDIKDYEELEPDIVSEETSDNIGNKDKASDELDLLLQELVPAILGDDQKTEIQKLGEEDFNEVIKFLTGLMNTDYTR